MISAVYRWLLPLRRVELLTLTDWWADWEANMSWVLAHRDTVQFHEHHWRDAA